MNGFVQGNLPPLTSVPPSAAQSFLVAAQGFFEGTEALATLRPQKLLACAFLSAQALECMLKAFLSHSGYAEGQLKSIGHDLEKLWVEAATAGLSVQSQPPQWCSMLNTAHNKPYYFRYPMSLNGMAFPALAPMISELKALLLSITGKIR